MKKILNLSVLLTAFIFVQAQVPSDCTIPPFLADAYEHDLKNMALRNMHQLHSADTALVTITAKWTGPIAEGLAAIFNARSIPERDSVFYLYCVHDQSSLLRIHKEILVSVDVSQPWTQAWQNLKAITGNAYVDSLVTRYDLSIEGFNNWAIGDYAIIRSGLILNTQALIDSLTREPGIFKGQPNSIIGVAGKITYDKIGTDRMYEFRFEFGDCPSGCTSYRTWKFKVASDCDVEYLGATSNGSALPTPFLCDLSTDVPEIRLEEEHYSIFPNPVRDFLTIKTANTAYGSTYVITDQLGRQILTGKLTNETTSIDIRQLTAGIYFFQAGQQNRQMVKLIKK